MRCVGAGSWWAGDFTFTRGIYQEYGTEILGDPWRGFYIVPDAAEKQPA